MNALPDSDLLRKELAARLARQEGLQPAVVEEVLQMYPQAFEDSSRLGKALRALIKQVTPRPRRSRCAARHTALPSQSVAESPDTTNS